MDTFFCTAYALSLSSMLIFRTLTDLHLSLSPMFRCDPCVEAGPDLSELADHYRHRGDDVAVIGINNESIFGVTKPADIDLLSSFLETNQDGFRYTILVDNDEGYAKDSTFVFEMEVHALLSIRIQCVLLNKMWANCSSSHVHARPPSCSCI